MIRPFSISSLIILIFFLNAYSQSVPDDILGVWFNQEKTSKIKIYKCGANGEKYCGKVVWLKRDLNKDGSPRVDKNNPDPKKRKTPLMDLVILKQFEYDKEKREWNKGTIYDPYTGFEYKCYIKRIDKILKVRGYVGANVIGRTADWTLVE